MEASWGDRWGGRWWALLWWGSTKQRTERGGDETKRGIVALFTPDVSRYSIKNPSATGALNAASITTSAPLNSLPLLRRVYWVLVPLQWASHMGLCVCWPSANKASEVIKKRFSVVMLQEGKWCYAFDKSINPSIRLIKQHDYDLHIKFNLQARWCPESFGLEDQLHTAQLKTEKL